MANPKSKDKEPEPAKPAKAVKTVIGIGLVSGADPQVNVRFEDGTEAIHPISNEQYDEFEKCFADDDWRSTASKYYASHF